MVGTDGAARNIFFVGSIAFQDVAHKVSALKVFLDRGDMARLKEIQEAVLQMSAPKALVITRHIIIFFFPSSAHAFLDASHDEFLNSLVEK